VAKPEKAQASRKRVRVSFIDSVQNREKWRQRQGGLIKNRRQKGAGRIVIRPLTY
jgi:hypothetical protein